MKILLAGPGTGKTTRIKSIIASEFTKANRIKVLSFTNFTVNDLNEYFADDERVSCSTLHSFAFGLNHQKDLYVATDTEKRILEKLAEKAEIALSDVCEQLGCVTFDGMIARSAAFINANPVYSKDKIGTLDLLLVDEFQDFNPSEQALVNAVSQYASETILLGDDDQSIYGFKDADPDGIISIFNDAAVGKIEHENICYRCPDAVVDLASKLISYNKRRIAKEWRKNGKEGSVGIQQFRTGNDADEFVLKRISEIRDEEPNASILVLSRLRLIVESLRSKLGDDNPEIVYCWAEPDLDLQAQVWWMCAIFLDDKLKFLVFLLGTRRLSANKKVVKFLKEVLNEGILKSDAVNRMLDMRLFPDDMIQYLRKQPDIEQFFLERPEFERLTEFIDRTNLKKSIFDLSRQLRKDIPFEKGKVNLMSIHKSKGLQADYVFILGLTSGILPNDQEGLDTIEAQRRLLFVGVTRALKQLYLLSTIEWTGVDLRTNNADLSQFQFRYQSRNYRGKASRFIEEMK